MDTFKRRNSCCTIFPCCLFLLILMLIFNGSLFLLIYSFKTPPSYSSLFLFYLLFLGKITPNLAWRWLFENFLIHVSINLNIGSSILQLSDRESLAQFSRGELRTQFCFSLTSQQHSFFVSKISMATTVQMRNKRKTNSTYVNKKEWHTIKRQSGD